MRFFNSHRAKQPGKLPTTSPKTSQETPIAESMRKSSSISSPSSPRPAKHLPTRTTTILEPSIKHTPSNATTRPPLQRRRTTAKTRWIDMHLEQENFPKWHNLLASFFTWVLLAGFIVFPATFNNFQKDDDLGKQANNELQAHALRAAKNVPLLYVAGFACGIGVLGCVWLWVKHWRNYLWVNNRIVLPALMNSIAGLISTIVNVYTAQDGQYSVTAKITIVVTSACCVVTLLLLLIFNFILLARVKRKHERETSEIEKQFTGGEDYGYSANLKDKRRKAAGKKGRRGGSDDVGRMV